MITLRIGKRRIVTIKQMDIWSFFIFVILMDFPFLDSKAEMIFKGIGMIIMHLLAVLERENKYLFKDAWPIILYAFFIVLSSNINSGFSETFIRSCIYALIFISVYWFIGLLARKHGVKETLHSLFRVLCFIVFVTDTLVILTNGKGIDNTTYLANFLVGNKFFVAYLNMLCFSLYLCQKEKICFRNTMLLLIVMLIICLKAGTATGAIGLISVALLYFSKCKIGLKLSNMILFFGALTTSSVLVTSFKEIMSNPVVIKFVTKILGRNLSLTGRDKIYEMLVPIFRDSPWIGHGYNNSIVWNTIGFGNPQNGVWDILINYGIVGLGLFCILCFVSIKSVKRKYYDYIFPLLCFLYGMIVCATVEICLTYFFIMGLAIIRIFGTAKSSFVEEKKGID